MTHRYTKRELLEEGFWDKFKSAGSKLYTAGKEITKVVAPEISDPLTKIRDKGREIGTKLRKAGATSDALAIERIKEDGYFPDGNSVKWSKNRNTDGTINGVIQVSELDYAEDGSPTKGSPYKNPNLIVQYDYKTKDIKIIKRPRRDSYDKNGKIIAAD